ncbi:MAG TPA: c-type cytochrome [Terriglobia bacterium]|nr:c-type cytochrome [Terriglobia bacterium]
MPDVPSQPSQQQDPITSNSLSLPLLIATLVMMLTVVWALVDEVYLMRPWKGYQKRFVETYKAYLQRAIPEAAERERAVREDPEYQRLVREAEAAQQAVNPQIAEIDREVSQILDPQIAVLNRVFAEQRMKVSALVYQLEKASSDSSKQSIQEEIEEARTEILRVSMPATAAGPGERREFQYAALEAELERLKARKAELQTQRIQLLANATELRRKADTYLREHLGGLTEEQMRGLQRQVENFRVEIKQIHIADIDLVDRCESCHLAIREPLVLTAEDMGGERAFTSHPRPELLKIHDPERFGCSPCHNGNGRATSSVVKGHGRHRFWLWPLYARENFEAGCQQCHTRDRYLPEATTLNEGKFLYDHRGCVGCHRYEGYDTEPEELLAVQQEILQKEAEKRNNLLEVERTIAAADRAETNEEAAALYAKADGLRVASSGIDAQLEQLDARVKNLLLERKKVGPSLKEVRVKLRKEWLPVWLENPHAFRPSTRMPRFRLDEDQKQAIAAFIWQSGVNGRLPAQPPGNAANGKELFETRGCMGCHSIGEGDAEVGGTFAANLSRVGEKVNYDYLVRWIRNPRERTAPYCPYEKRDLTPEDYARHGLPYVFDVDHTLCPNDGHELQVQQMTVMPNLRLTLQEARDIATYLMSQKQQEPADYPPAPYLDDPAMKAKGLPLVRHFGCAGCHEISGLEEEGRIGTELTKEGSKPIERLDFALLTHEAEREGWYNHKGFFERKLENPAIYDTGKVKEPLEKLRMPNFNLSPREITALTTFLLGSVESNFPERYFYAPEDERRDIQEGWEVVLKYNCMGCHVVRIGQRSVLMDLPRYQSPDWKEQLPPSLIGEGARVNPQWLAAFLQNPALSETDLNRNGVRPYLRARMPTFYFSQGEILKLIRFFEALSHQPEPYIAPEVEPLTPVERSLARALFRSQGAPCLECHATGDPVHDQRATAPNFLLAKSRLKPEWTKRWMLDPSMMAPGTAMPSGLFRQEGNRWVFAGPTPPGFAQYTKDHADLLVRYIFEFTAAEQQ